MWKCNNLCTIYQCNLRFPFISKVFQVEVRFAVFSFQLCFALLNIEWPTHCWLRPFSAENCKIYNGNNINVTNISEKEKANKKKEATITTTTKTTTTTTVTKKTSNLCWGMIQQHPSAKKLCWICREEQQQPSDIIQDPTYM